MIEIDPEDDQHIVVMDQNGCTDTLVIQICEHDPLDLQPDTLYYTTPFETPIYDICIETDEFICSVDSFYFCGFPLNGSATFIDSICLDYSPDMGYEGHDEICVVVCDVLGNCDTTIIIITIEGSPCYDFLDDEEIWLDAGPCDSVAELCIPIALEDIINFNITDNGDTYYRWSTGM